MAMYFTDKTDDALKLFLKTPDVKDKNEIFTRDIRPAFEKLIENIIFVYRFYHLDDPETLKKECLSNLYEMISRFDPAKCTKGFSYFNVITKNWFIQKIRERNKRSKLESELYYDLDHEMAKNDPSFSVSPHEDFLVDRERMLTFYDEMESWKDKLTKKGEKEILNAVVFLLQNPDLVAIYNKKAVYLYLRELTGLNTKQVVINLKKIKGLYNEWYEKYCVD